MCTEPKFGYDPSTIINAVKVVGGKPKGAKKPVKARAVAQKNHPLSPWSLRRNGKRRYYTKAINDSSIKSKKAAKARAREELRAGLRESLNVEFEALVNPLHEEGDVIKVKYSGNQTSSRLVQWSIPLTHDGKMSIGVNKKVSFKTKRSGSRSGNRNRRPR